MESEQSINNIFLKVFKKFFFFIVGVRWLTCSAEKLNLVQKIQFAAREKKIKLVMKKFKIVPKKFTK